MPKTASSTRPTQNTGKEPNTDIPNINGISIFFRRKATEQAPKKEPATSDRSNAEPESNNVQGTAAESTRVIGVFF